MKYIILCLALAGCRTVGSLGEVASAVDEAHGANQITEREYRELVSKITTSMLNLVYVATNEPVSPSEPKPHIHPKTQKFIEEVETVIGTAISTAFQVQTLEVEDSGPCGFRQIFTFKDNRQLNVEVEYLV